LGSTIIQHDSIYYSILDQNENDVIYYISNLKDWSPLNLGLSKSKYSNFAFHPQKLKLLIANQGVWQTNYLKKDSVVNAANAENRSVQKQLSNIIYPNPSMGDFTIKSTKILEKIQVIRIYDLFGRRVSKIQNLDSELYHLQNTKLKPGLYFIHIGNGETQEVHSLVISRNRLKMLNEYIT
jgi:hypothetical protein